MRKAILLIFTLAGLYSPSYAQKATFSGQIAKAGGQVIHFKIPNSLIDNSYQTKKLFKDAEGNFDQSFTLDRPTFVEISSAEKSARLFFAPDYALTWVADYQNWASPISVFGAGTESNMFMMRYSASFPEATTQNAVVKALKDLNSNQFEKFADSLKKVRLDYIKKYKEKYPINESCELYIAFDIDYYIAGFKYQYANYQIQRLLLGETVDLNPEFFKFEKNLVACNPYLSNNPVYWKYLDEYIQYKAHSEYFKANGRYMDMTDPVLFYQKAYYFVEFFFESNVRNLLKSRLLYNCLGQKELQEVTPAIQSLYQHYLLTDAPDIQKSLVSTRYESLRLKSK